MLFVFHVFSLYYLYVNRERDRRMRERNIIGESSALLSYSLFLPYSVPSIHRRSLLEQYVIKLM